MIYPYLFWERMNDMDIMKNYSDPVMPLEIADRFDIIECFAVNDYSETYLLSEKNSGKRFVLKSYKKSEDAPPVDEAELLQGLEHEGLPKFEGRIEKEDQFYILREFIEGVPLDEYLLDNPVSEAQSINIIMELCDILSYLHTQPEPIIHRDIKPSNIIINPIDNKITLIDFGISRKYTEGAETDTCFFGTQKFAPPEQYGFAQTDCRADIYALGMVFRYLLSGDTESKWKGNKALQKIADKCTAFSPENRFQNAVVLKKALLKHKRHVKQKISYAAVTILFAGIFFAAGFAVGRYTDLLHFQSPETTNENIVVFTEPLVEKAVRLVLQKDDSQPVTYDELRNVKAIYIVGDQVASSDVEWDLISKTFYEENLSYGTLESLDDLRTMENLEQLYLFAQPLADLSPLEDLVRLNHLEAKQCNILSAAPLTDLPRLKVLQLFDNPIEDFSSFQKMKSLRFLDIGNNSLSNLSQLGGAMPELRSLGIHRTQVSSLAGIENYVNLESLLVVDTAIRDFSPLDGLPNLKEIRISKDMEEYLFTLSRTDLDIIIEE